MTLQSFCLKQVYKVQINRSIFGELNETPIYKYCLSNDNNMEVNILNYGAIIQSILLPLSGKDKTNVTLGFDNLEDYLDNNAYIGAIAGRYANRIKGGKLVINGKQYQLSKNNGNNHLHGGTEGFNKKLWKVKTQSNDNQALIELTYSSTDGDENYPGNLNVKVIYKLTNDNKFIISYEAVTDQDTIVNLTQHTYFNLEGKRDCLNHKLKINASRYLATDENAIPLPGIASVDNTPMSFRSGKLIGNNINDKHIQLQQAKGFDHCWLIDHPKKDSVSFAATVESENGCRLDVYTDQPGIQFYSGNYLTCGTNGLIKDYSGFALETQQLPNAPNRPDFPSTIITPYRPYSHNTEWHFYWK